MSLPAIYTQPIGGLENFEMNGDDLAVVVDCFRKIEAKENGGHDSDQEPVTATNAKTTLRSSK